MESKPESMSHGLSQPTGMVNLTYIKFVNSFTFAMLCLFLMQPVHFKCFQISCYHLADDGKRQPFPSTTNVELPSQQTLFSIDDIDLENNVNCQIAARNTGQMISVEANVSRDDLANQDGKYSSATPKSSPILPLHKVTCIL